MSMLAEGRKKRKRSLNSTPRGSAWMNDSSKFGEQMLRKMGWSEGQGLGVKKQGITEQIKFKVKQDSKGLGFKDKDHVWVEVENDFSSLLEKLSSQQSSEETSSISVASTVSSSLEEQSKKSKARVHYQKFTRGKDLSRYSAKDLECIFGISKKSKITDEGKNFVEGGNMNEYFENKKKGNGEQETVAVDERVKERKRKHDNTEDIEEEQIVSDEISGAPVKKKKKKAKKAKCERENEDAVEKQEDKNEISKKERKSNKLKQQLREENEQICEENERKEKKKSKKKKKNKNKRELVLTQLDGACDSSEMDDVSEISVELDLTKAMKNDYANKARLVEKPTLHRNNNVKLNLIGKTGNKQKQNKQIEVSNPNIYLEENKNLVGTPSQENQYGGRKNGKTTVDSEKNVDEITVKTSEAVPELKKPKDASKVKVSASKVKPRLGSISDTNTKLGSVLQNKIQELSNSMRHKEVSLTETNEQLSKHVESVVQTKINNYLSQVFNRKDKIKNPKQEAKDKRKALIAEDKNCVKFNASNLMSVGGYQQYY